MSYGLRVWNPSTGQVVLDTSVHWGGLCVDLWFVPANSGAVQRTYPNFLGCSLAALAYGFSPLRSGSLDATVTYPGGTPTIDLANSPYARWVAVFAVGQRSIRSGYGLETVTAQGNNQLVNDGFVPSFLGRYSPIAAVDLSYDFIGGSISKPWGWRYQVGSDSVPLAFVPVQAGRFAAIHNIANLGGTTWAIDLAWTAGGVTPARQGDPPNLLVFGRRAAPVSGPTYGVRLWQKDGSLAFDGNASPVRLKNVPVLPSYVAARPAAAPSAAYTQVGLPAASAPAVLLPFPGIQISYVPSGLITRLYGVAYHYTLSSGQLGRQGFTIGQIDTLDIDGLTGSYYSLSYAPLPTIDAAEY